MSGLYLESGYLNQDYIYKTAVGSGCSFIVEIGGRQVGKTYGAIQHTLRRGDPFLYMRRTQAEIDFISAGIGSPFSEHDESITTKKAGRYTAEIRRGEDRIGIMAGLSSMAKIRGFSWHDIKTVIYDEFIPERHVARIRDEGDAFLNAMITVTGNRELQGEPPPMVWLLANPNLHSNPITDALGIATAFDRMETRGKEISILQDKGIVLVRPSSEQIMERRRHTAVFRAAGTDSELARMSLGNEFAYDDSTGVGSANIHEYTAIVSVMGHITIWQHKSRSDLYITDCMGELGSVYYNNAPDLESFGTLWSPVIRAGERNHKVIYQSMEIKDRVNKLTYRI